LKNYERKIKNMIQELKNKLDIVRIAIDAGYVPNRNNFIKSIYKEENNPSLKLYPETNSYHCFSENRGGDVIQFYQDLKKFDFRTAIEELKKMAGIETVKKFIQPEIPIVRTKIKLTGSEEEYFQEMAGIFEYDYKLNRMDAEQAAYQTIKNERAAMQKLIYKDLSQFCGEPDSVCIEYLTGPKRWLHQDVIKRFGIFCIKDVTKTIAYLKDNYSIDHLLISGLLNEKKNFVFGKNTVIIPYYEKDKIVYLRARNFSSDTTSNKYVGLSNFSGNLTARRLFNADMLKALKKGDKILICEGEFDCIIAVQNGYNAIGIPGINNAPANLGTLLKDFNITIAFDNDEAGRRGTKQISNQLMKRTEILRLIKHKDLTELLSSEKIIDLFDNEFVEKEIIEPIIIKKSKLNLVTAKKIQEMELPPVEWIVEKLLTPGLIILAGRPKAGKSWFSLNLSLSVTRGGKALSYFNSVKADVIYFALEDNVRRIKSRLENILNAEYDRNAPPNLYFLEDDVAFPKLNEGGLDELQNMVADHPDVKLLIIDTLGRSRADQKRSDNNIYLADYELLAKLQRFALKNKIAVVVVHHTKKGGEENVFDEISGTTGITGAADTIILIKRIKKQNKLFITGRDIEEATYDLYFDRDSFTWNVLEPAQDSLNLTVERSEIIDLLTSEQRMMRTGEIAQVLGKEQSNVSHLLKALKEEGLVMSPKYGFYQLSEAPKNNQTPA